jgi:preprotein translocase subunit SecE
MAADDDNKKTDEAESDELTEGHAASSAESEGAAEAGAREGGEAAEEDEAPAAAQLGATRYVMAGFFVTAMAAAYVVGRLLATIWGKLAEALWFQKSLALMARVGEEERSEYATVVGAILALGGAVYAYRRADVRQWTDEVASELSKVTWPDKAEVTNSTVVVIVTSAFATVYLALLDRFWGFVTNLVYG